MNRRTDFWLILVVSVLVLIGLVMVYSASAVVASDDTGDATYFFTRQLVAVGVGLVACIATALTPLATIRRWRLAGYVACVVALALVFVPGLQHRANGAARWLGPGSLHLQPSEFTKIVVLLMLADFLDRYRGYLGDWKIVARALLIPLPVLLLILPEPDFGTTAILAGLSGLMLFTAGMRVSHIGALVGGSAALGIPVMLGQGLPGPAPDQLHGPLGRCGQRGLPHHPELGRLPQRGTAGSGPGQLHGQVVLPARAMDRLHRRGHRRGIGLVAIAVIMALFCVLVWRGLAIARRARDPFGMFLAATLTAMIGLSAFFNFAVIMGMVPPKGLVLPFISYGASAMIANLWAVGMLLSISAEAEAGPVATASPVEGWPLRHDLEPGALQGGAT